MDTATLITAINEVLQSQSEEEIISVLNRYSELMEEETLMQIRARLEQDRQSGRNENVEALQGVLHNIAVFAQTPTEAAQTSPLPSIESKVSWAIKAQRYLALRKSELLDEAIAEAQDKPEIVEFLESFQQNDLEKTYQLIEPLFSQLHQSNRDEEGYTINLFYLDPRTRLTEQFINFPFEQQQEMRELGIQSSRPALQISEILQDHPCQAVYLVRLAIGFYSSRQPHQAEDFCFKALEIYQQLTATEPDIFRPYVALTLNHLGNAQSSQRKLREAETSYREALEIYQQLAAAEPYIFLPDVAGTLNNLGNAQSDQRKLRAAENSYRESLEISRTLAAKEPDIFLKDVAGTLNNLGLVQSDQRELREAESFYLEALDIYHKLAVNEPHIFLSDMAKTLTNLGNAQREQRKLRESENSHCEALVIRRKLAENEPDIFLPDVALILNNLGNAQSEQRKLREGEASFHEALEIYRQLAVNEPDNFLPDMARTLTNLGTAQSDQRKWIEAEISYREALEIRRRLAENEPYIFLKDVAAALHNLGNAQRGQSRLQEAEISYREALEIYQKLATSEPHIFLKDVAATLTNLGNAQREQRKLSEGESSFHKALDIYQKLAANEPHIFLPYVALILHNLGTAQGERRELGKAENLYRKALEIRRKLAASEPHIFLPDLIMTLNNLGYLFLEIDVQKAEKFFVEALELSEKLREKAVIIDDKTRIIQEHVNIYDGLLICYLNMQDWPQVLEIAERGKSRSLTDLLNLKSEALQPRSPTPETLAEVKELGRQYSDTIKKLQQLESLEKDLSQQIYQSYLSEAKQPLQAQQKETQKHRFAAEEALTKTLAKIHQFDPDFPPNAGSLKSEEIINISENRNRIIIIFRVLHETSAIIFVFPDGNLHVEAISNFRGEELLKLYADKWLISYLRSNKDLDLWFKAIEEVLDLIDEKLIFKVREVLNDKEINKTGTKDILFVPNQSLALLPLHAASRQENNRICYFLEDYNVSYCPSVSVFKRCLDNEPERSEKTLGIITPTKDLFGFAEEQLNMLKEFNAEVADLSKDEATLERVLETLKEDYGFIHFYCHGEFAQENPFDSGLTMTDGKLTLSEIINTNLKENWLTVLSACETGMVDFQSPTDEHFGLPLGFVFAGSPSVWASLWSVSAYTTSDLMEKAYQNLNKPEFKNNKSGALRQAQIEMSQDENFSHPFYWAGFQHFGV